MDIILRIFSVFFDRQSVIQIITYPMSGMNPYSENWVGAGCNKLVNRIE
jgi:hypothetical protein